MRKSKLIGTGAVIVLVVLFVFTFIYPRFTNMNKQNQGIDKKEIIIGSSPGPYTDLFQKGIEPILKKKGYHFQNKPFSVLLNADIALNQNEINLNVEQHTAYLNNFNKEKHAKLIPITKIPTVPTAIYPGNKNKLSEIKPGDKIAIPNDPANTARAFNLLAKEHWIALKPHVNPIKATTNDIQNNKYHLKITEMDSGQIPRSRKDFAFTIIPGSDSYPAHIPAREMLAKESLNPQYVLVAATNQQNIHDKWVKAVKEAYRSKQFTRYLNQHNKDHYWYNPNQ